MLAGTALAALTLLLPSSPTYDPWSWLVWGREVAHLDLDTVAGPSWKPLPVLFTTVFSLFGDAAPDLWVLVGRLGGLLSLVLVFRLARRAVDGPYGTLAGLVGALALFISTGWLHTVALGNSEGLLVFGLLAALERHLDGRRVHALAFLVAAGLLRPETWPLLGLYGLWLLVVDPAARPWVLGFGVLVPALWFGPELWGSGQILRSAERATHANAGSAAYAKHPALAILQKADRLTLDPFKLAAALAFVLGVVDLVRRRRGGVECAVGLGSLGWLGLIAALTQAGYAGNLRYLIPVSAGVSLLAGIGFARVAEVVQGVLAGLAARRRSRPDGRLRLVAGVAVLVAAAPFVVPQQRFVRVDLRNLALEARLYDDMGPALARVGGPAAVLRCGQAATARFDVSALAWRLGVHGRQVGFQPHPPGVFLQPRAEPQPLRRAVPPVGGYRSVGTTSRWDVLAACPPGTLDPR